MKTRNIFVYILFSLLVALGSVSCTKGGLGDGEPVDNNPAFPELVENYAVKPGSVLSITFTPNYDWKVSIPSDMKQWFWIIDGSFRLSDHTGKKSTEPVTVNIGVTDTDEFDKSFSCTVTMTMDGKSADVAKYMLPAKERTITVYAAVRDENGNFSYSEDGQSYVYSETPASDITLLWSVEDADFRAPLKVSSNFQWTLECPSWTDVNVPENTLGTVELLLTGVSLDAAEGNLTFKQGPETVNKQLKVSIPSAKDVKVYSATVTEGELDYAEEGDYAWTQDPVASVSLAWLGSDFRMPVLIDSKCNWTMELPQWLSADIMTDEEDVTGKTAGRTTVVFKGIPSEYPLDSKTGKVVLKSDDTVLSEFDVTIPGCKDIMSWSVNMGLTELDFNAAGDLKTALGYEPVPVEGMVLGTSAVQVFAVERVAGKYNVSGQEQPSWVNIEMSAYNTASSSPVLQERTVTVTVDENTGDERSAALFCVPYDFWGELGNLFNDDLTQVKEEYAGYFIEIKQYSNDVEYIMMSSSSGEMASVGASFAPADEMKAASLTAQFGQTSYVYTLSYEYLYSRDNAWMNLARPYNYIKYYDSEYTLADSSFWLSYSAGNEDGTYGQFVMYKDEESLPEEPSTGYAVFYDSNDGVLAIVECVSPKAPEVITPPDQGETPAEDVKEDISRKFIVKAASAISNGAKLERITAGPTYNSEMESIGNANAEVWLLTLPDYDSAVEILLNGKKSKFYQMPYALRSYITVNDTETEGTATLSTGISTAKIKMSEIPSDVTYIPHLRFHVDVNATYAFLIVYLTVKQ